jgi:hypothetical protein
MKRRAFFAALGGAAAWPVVARGQQQPKAIVGYLVFSGANDSMTDSQPSFVA